MEKWGQVNKVKWRYPGLRKHGKKFSVPFPFRSYLLLKGDGGRWFSGINPPGVLLAISCIAAQSSVYNNLKDLPSTGGTT